MSNKDMSACAGIMEPRWEIWRDALFDLADGCGIDLEANRYSYRTYFYRGWSPESVIEEIAELTKQPVERDRS